MREYAHISENEKWNAIVNCDRSYDGLFFYGVKTTGVFCRPSCKAKTPVRSNVLFFHDAAAAITAGYRPCKKCCPHKEFFEPDFEIVEKAKEIINANFDKPIDLNSISKQLGVSTNHLIRLFKRSSGFTPADYITKLRIEKSVEFLSQGDINVLEAAYMSGYKSLSNFYRCFKKHMGYTPGEHRKNRRDS